MKENHFLIVLSVLSVLILVWVVADRVMIGETGPFPIEVTRAWLTDEILGVEDSWGRSVPLSDTNKIEKLLRMNPVPSWGPPNEYTVKLMTNKEIQDFLDKNQER